MITFENMLTKKEAEQGIRIYQREKVRIWTMVPLVLIVSLFVYDTNLIYMILKFLGMVIVLLLHYMLEAHFLYLANFKDRAIAKYEIDKHTIHVQNANGSGYTYDLHKQYKLIEQEDILVVMLDNKRLFVVFSKAYLGDRIVEEVKGILD